MARLSLLFGFAALALLSAACAHTQAEPSSDQPAGPEQPRSQVLSVTAPPEARPYSWPSVPDDSRVVWGGCATDGTCRTYNFYWAPTRELVMQRGEAPIKVLHEACHAHQHLAINGGATLEPSNYDLESWYNTDEGRSFSRAVAGLPWPWSHSAKNPLEDFAWTCAYWYSDAAHLQSISPTRYDWAAANLS